MGHRLRGQAPARPRRASPDGRGGARRPEPPTQVRGGVPPPQQPPTPQHRPVPRRLRGGDARLPRPRHGVPAHVTGRVSRDTATAAGAAPPTDLHPRQRGAGPGLPARARPARHPPRPHGQQRAAHVQHDGQDRRPWRRAHDRA